MRGMLGTRSRAAWALVALAALALGVIASGALAGAKLKTKSQTVEVDPGSQEFGSASAKCKRGTKAVSGGFEAEEEIFNVPSPNPIPNQSSRTGGRAWTTVAINGGPEPGDLTSFAYCRDEKVERRAATESVASDEIETLAAKCKRGQKAISGGFDSDQFDLDTGAGPSFRFTISRKVGRRGWEVRAENVGDEAGDLTAQVNCREGKGLKTKQQSGDFGVGGSSTEAFELEAKCKRSQRVVSGGFAGPDDVPADDFKISPFASMKVGKRGWHVDGKARGEVTVYAYCEKKNE